MEAPLPTRKLGKTGVELPILGFGTAAAGSRLTLREAVTLFEAALSAGITYFDTAPDFAGYGNAQRYLGHVVRDRRKEMFLVTKCFEPDGERALRLLERNLQELQTDHADLVFVHSLGNDKMDPRQVFARNGVFQALQYAKRQGMLRWIGLSGHNRPGRFRDAIERVDVDVLLNAVNYVDRHTYNFEEDVWRRAAEKQIGLIAMKVFGGEGHEPSKALSRCMVPAASLDLAFRYAMTVPGVCCASIGMATPQELADNVRRAKAVTPLSGFEQRALWTEGQRLAGQWQAHFGTVA